MGNKLYLGSQSKARQKLLEIASIDYEVIEHKSDECGVRPSSTFADYVLAISEHKMEHIELPAPTAQEPIFVLTADTLMQTAKTKKILGKPQDKDHAKEMIASYRNEMIELVTACCLEKKEFLENGWHTIASKHWTTPATLEFSVDENLVDLYLEKMPHAMNACGAGIIEGFGFNFLKSVSGSFTAVLGLPLYELRQALKDIGF